MNELGAEIGHDAQIRQWAATDDDKQHRNPTPANCCLLELATGGDVDRRAMRPKDWHLIWPELIGAEGAPAIEQPTQA